MNIEVTYFDGTNVKLTDVDNGAMWSILDGLIPDKIPHILARAEQEMNNAKSRSSYSVDIRYFDGSSVKIDGLENLGEVSVFLVGHHPKTYHEGAVNLTVREKEKTMAKNVDITIKFKNGEEKTIKNLDIVGHVIPEEKKFTYWVEGEKIDIPLEDIHSIHTSIHGSPEECNETCKAPCKPIAGHA